MPYSSNFIASRIQCGSIVSFSKKRERKQERKALVPLSKQKVEPVPGSRASHLFCLLTMLFTTVSFIVVVVPTILLFTIVVCTQSVRLGHVLP